MTNGVQRGPPPRGDRDRGGLHSASHIATTPATDLGADGPHTARQHRAEPLGVLNSSIRRARPRVRETSSSRCPAVMMRRESTIGSTASTRSEVPLGIGVAVEHSWGTGMAWASIFGAIVGRSTAEKFRRSVARPRGVVVERLRLRSPIQRRASSSRGRVLPFGKWSSLARIP